MAVAPRAPGDYAPLAGGRAVEALQDAAAPLRGARVLHVSAAGAPGPVPELLGGVLPLAAGAGLAVEWRVLFADPDLRRVGAALEHGLRGGESAIQSEDWEAWTDACERIGRSLNGTADLVVLHDPARSASPPASTCRWPGAATWMPRALRTRRSSAWAALLEHCRLTLVPHESFAPDALRDDRLQAAPPGIDPLDSAQPRPRAAAAGPRRAAARRGPRPSVRAARSCSSTAGTTRTRRSRRSGSPRPRSPSCSWCSPGCSTTGAAEDWRAAKEVSDYAAGEEDLLLLTSYEGLGSLEVGALQRLARAALELSLREGFDLAPCETLWKRTPVVGRADGGLRFTVRDGVDGFLAGDAERLAARLVELVRDPGLAGRDGPRRPRAGARALPRNGGARARAAGAGGWRPGARRPIAWRAHEGHAPRRLSARAPGRRHRRRRRRARSARAWPAPRSGCARTATCATSTRRSPRAPVEIVTAKDPDALWLIRHDAAHVLATAVLELYPGVKISIGPPIDDGFYYDFEFPEGVKVSDDDFERIEAEDARAHRRRRALRAHGRPGGGGDRALQGRGPGLQGRADRGPGRATRAWRPSRSTATAPSPTSAAARTAPAPSASRRSS